MFHNIYIFNARKVEHSKVKNKNILNKKCKNDPNYQKVDQMAIFHFLRDDVFVNELWMLYFPALSKFILWNISTGIYITEKLTR